MRDYFLAHNQYFWQWEEQGAVIAIPNASTVAYKDYLGDVLKKLSPQGLPPLGSLLLAIVATNPDGKSSLDIVYKIVSDALGTTDDVNLARAINFLKLLADVPPSFRSGPKRIEMLQVLFERCHNILSVRNSEAVLEQYRTGFALVPAAFNRHVVTLDFRTLSLLESKFPDTDAILKRIASLPDDTQLQIAFEKQETNEDDAGKNDLLDELISNNKTFAVGSLIPWLWGGLNIPVHSSVPSQQPLGGISDLTNKGSFDKLLISEFANDDIFFLSRLANNEALYIHREIPPIHNDRQRFILVDSTLRSWGTPRAISFALMLAIMRHPKTDIACSAFVLGSDQYYSISTDSIENIIDALQIIEGNLHPGKALDNFLNDFGQQRNAEVFLITEKNTITLPGVLKVINEHQGKIPYTILTDSFGNIDVYKRDRRGSRHVQHLQLPLDQLWTKETKSIRKEPSGTTFNVDYPILLRGDRMAKAVLTAPDGEVFQCTSERSVLRLFDFADHKKRGWDLVCRDLPFKSDICEVGINKSGHYILLLFEARTKEIVLLNLQTGQKQVLIFNSWKSGCEPSFVFNSGMFFHVNAKGAWCISPEGAIETAGEVDVNIFKDRKKVLTEAALKYRAHDGLFKSLKKVFINKGGEIVFNIHTLKLSPDGRHLKLVTTSDLSEKVIATNNDDNIFSFEDGSSVEIQRSGLLILRSSDRMVPAIYLPTALDTSLGIATSDEFAGNHYYYKDQTYRLVLKEFGGNRDDVAKLMESHLNMSPELVSEYMLVELPADLSAYCPAQKARSLQDAFSNTGARVDLELPEGKQELKRVTTSASDFFTKHVKRYINTIANYATDARPKR